MIEGLSNGLKLSIDSLIIISSMKYKIGSKVMKYKIGDVITRGGLWKAERLTITDIRQAGHETLYYCKAIKNGKWLSEDEIVMIV